MKKCCRNCKKLLPLCGHPNNKEDRFKSSISKETDLYACLLFSGKGVILEKHRLDSRCEEFEANREYFEYYVKMLTGKHSHEYPNINFRYEYDEREDYFYIYHDNSDWIKNVELRRFSMRIGIQYKRKYSIPKVCVSYGWDENESI